MLIYNGKINIENLSKAKITRDELLEAIREHGALSIEEVELGVLEMDGNISIITKQSKDEYVKKKIPLRIKQRE
ncbi:YetF domain-containing protein [Caldicellulosiruptor morganii]|uniref:YetF domain-containing protein n=1 Tax=Caldicellulosiruptor morganii TaxID=1387555 RepID=UPI001F52237B